MRVLTYNIAGHRGRGRAGYTDRVAELIRRVSPDVVGLQEVEHAPEAESPAETLARLTGMHAAFTPAHRARKRILGNLILSREPITSLEAHPLPWRFPEPRILMEAETSYQGRTVVVFNTHLVHLSAAGALIRRRQAAEVAFRMLRCGHSYVLTGDLNAPPGARELHPVRKAAAHHDHRGGVRSWPARRPIARFDHIWPGRDWEVAHVRALESHVSDHRPVLAHLRWRGYR